MTEDASARAEAEAFAHRALVAATVSGVLKLRRGLRVVVAGADASPDAGASAGADLLVMTDEGGIADGEVASVMGRARAYAGEDGVIALVVGSIVTRELVDAAGAAGEPLVAPGEHAGRAERGDAYSRAMGWAREHAGMALAAAVTPERLAHVVEAAAAAGLTLVEAESGAIAPSLARVRRMKSPRARALLATIALGAGARPMLFVPSGRAPKGGLARVKVERLAQGWVEARRPCAREVRADAPTGDLGHAALAILDEAARARRRPLPFKELLREVRERRSADARTHGARVTAGASDAADLAAFLHQRAAHESVLLYVLDPGDPGWTMMTAPPGLTL